MVIGSSDAPINISVIWQLLDALSLIMAGLDSRRHASLQTHGMQEQGRHYNFNDNVSPSLAAHSWEYLGFLWLYAGLTIVGALAPLYKYIPTEELLYPDYEFNEEETPMAGNEAQEYDYQDYNYDNNYNDYNQMSPNQRVSDGKVIYNHQASAGQDASSSGHAGYSSNSNSYPSPKYYGGSHYPPPPPPRR